VTCIEHEKLSAFCTQLSHVTRENSRGLVFERLCLFFVVESRRKEEEDNFTVSSRLLLDKQTSGREISSSRPTCFDNGRNE